MDLNQSRTLELGLIFIYIFAFGISDFLVRKYIGSDQMYLLYFMSIGIIGFLLIFRKDFTNTNTNVKNV